MPAAPNLNILTNPISVKCARARLRWKHVLSWGTVLVTLTAFICMGLYLTQVERGFVTAERAARSLVLPLIVIQSIILMFLGTGAVASNLAREREAGMLDYQRMTPMSPTAKILGYLFGLPAREYFLFALTLPFLLFAVIKGNFPLAALGKFYLVFFTSVWLYHMTGLVAGMASAKPRFAGVLAQGMVVVLYFVLPQLEIFGFILFEHLTMLPTLIGNILPEVLSAGDLAGEQYYDPGRITDVPFFEFAITPFAFTLLVQGFLLTFLYIVVHRKWQFEHSHPFSKLSATLFFSGTMVLLVGNIWPIAAAPEHFRQFMQRFDMAFGEITPVGGLMGVTFAFVLVAGGLSLLMINVITPTRHTAAKALQRARKLGRSRVEWNSDGATSLPATIIMVVLAWASIIGLLAAANRTDLFFHALPPFSAWLELLILFAAIVLFIQALRERTGGRVTMIVTFLLWMVPFFSASILYSAFGQAVAGTYVGLLFPPFAIGLTLSHFIEQSQAVNGEQLAFLSDGLEGHLPVMAWLATLLYAGLAVATQVERWRWKRRVHQREMARTTGMPSEAEIERAKVRAIEARMSTTGDDPVSVTPE